MQNNKINIAIDGYSSCGKSTLAKLLAKELKYSYVDTGAMYRSFTLYLDNNGLIQGGKTSERAIENSLNEVHISFRFNPKKQNSDTYLNGKNVEKEIRSPRISDLVSGVSKIKKVRQQLIALQKEIGKEKGVVMDGRDIGTAVLPNAEIKFFMEADLEIRTQRRYDELKFNGYEISFNEVKENLLQRDYNDINRKENPLVKAEDAITLDNSELTIDELLAISVNKIKEVIEKK